jgi:iron-sulfur cluster assembly protein
MLHCSEKAVAQIQKLQAMRVAGGKKPALGLRIGIRGGGCNGFGYVFEWCETEPRKTDQVFEFAGGDVRIFCDPKSLIYLKGTTLDYVTGLMGHGFKFENPNAKGACGCGESVQF